MEAVEIVAYYDVAEEAKHRIHKASYLLSFFSAMDGQDYPKDIVAGPLHYLGVIYDALKKIGDIECKIEKSS